MLDVPHGAIVVSMATKIAIIGAGNVGGNLGVRLSHANLPVRFGVRKTTPETEALLARCASGTTAVDVGAAAAWGEVVILAVPGNVALEVARSLTKQLAGKIVVDCNNPLTWSEGPVWAPPAEGSLTAAIAKAIPTAKVLKAFNTFGAEHHADPGATGGAAEVLVAGDDAAAKATLSEIATTGGFHAVDAGPLRNAAVLENFAILWIHLATVGGQGRNFVFAMQRAK